MVTFHIELGKPTKAGEMKVYIAVVANRERKRIAMPFSVKDSEIDKHGNITNQLIAFAVEERIIGFRKRLMAIGAKADTMTAAQVAEAVTTDTAKDDGPFELDFFKFGYDHVEKLRSEERLQTANSYKAALNNFRSFILQDKLDINSITKMMLLKYQDWFNEHHGGERAWELYMTNLQSLHNMARARFNDEDEDVVRIPRQPFKQVKFKRGRAKVRETEKRALSADAIRLLFELPYKPARHGVEPRCNMALDAFRMSFGLCGMNAIDMYNLPKLDGDGLVVAYYRQKTHKRSGVDSYTIVTIPEQIRAISAKRKGRRHAWNFQERYMDIGTFNAALNYGLKEMVVWASEHYGKSAEELGLPEGLTFYSARHSWATIAANDCGIPMDVVDRALCHVVDSVAAQSYVKRDYSVIDEANEKVMRFVVW